MLATRVNPALWRVVAVASDMSGLTMSDIIHRAVVERVQRELKAFKARGLLTPEETSKALIGYRDVKSPTCTDIYRAWAKLLRLGYSRDAGLLPLPKSQ
jgi:hypothetical protein